MITLTGVGGFIASKSAVASVLSPQLKSNVVLLTDTSATDRMTKDVNAVVFRKILDAGIKTYTVIALSLHTTSKSFPGFKIIIRKLFPAIHRESYHISPTNPFR